MKKLFITVFLSLFVILLTLSFAISALGQEKILDTQLIEKNPVNIRKYLDAQIDFIVELFKRFTDTAKPNVHFQDRPYAGLQISIYEPRPKSIWERPKWALVLGKVIKEEDKDLFHQPTFFGVEYRGIPLLSDAAKIFKKMDVQLLFSQRSLYFGLSYEFREKKES